MSLLRILAPWLLFIPVAFLNGIARQSLYKPLTGDLLAHQISTVTASAAFIALTYVMLGDRVAGLGPWQLLGIGALWVLMTMAFEFGFGHYVFGTPWERLIADYNLLAGRVWSLFLLAILFSPLIVRAVRSA